MLKKKIPNVAALLRRRPATLLSHRGSLPLAAGSQPQGVGHPCSPLPPPCSPAVDAALQQMQWRGGGIHHRVASRLFTPLSCPDLVAAGQIRLRQAKKKNGLILAEWPDPATTEFGQWAARQGRSWLDEAGGGPPTAGLSAGSVFFFNNRSRLSL